MKKVYTFSTSELVTEIRVQLTRRPPILAFIDITLWGTMVIHDLRLLERNDGTRVLLMPRLQASDGSWTTIAHPIREKARKAIEASVISCYEHASGERALLQPIAANA